MWYYIVYYIYFIDSKCLLPHIICTHHINPINGYSPRTFVYVEYNILQNGTKYAGSKVEVKCEFSKRKRQNIYIQSSKGSTSGNDGEWKGIERVLKGVTPRAPK